jgi:hypothetical protein
MSIVVQRHRGDAVVGRTLAAVERKASYVIEINRGGTVAVVHVGTLLFG